MTIEKDNNRGCICGTPCTVNLLQISSIIRDFRDQPCLNNSHIKGSKMLRPDKWQAIFDSDGRIYGFKKALKSITIGGIDPSIRTEVWEFLLGCYALDSTAEYRRQLRMARREKYMDLIKQCQAMHSSVGTGTLAHVVGSKVMDVRTASKDENHREAEVGSRRASQDSVTNLEVGPDLKIHGTESIDACQRESSSDSADIVSDRGSIESSSNYVTECYFDFPPLPVTNLFQKIDADDIGCKMHDERTSSDRRFILVDEPMHSFQINNNVDLIIESNSSPSNDKPEMFSSNDQGHKDSANLEYKSKIVNRLRTSNVTEAVTMNGTASNGAIANEERISEWLWTLHRIVVDVVRTDSHLTFFEDAKNMARMSDILAVYAWVDPATGYCQA